MAATCPFAGVPDIRTLCCAALAERACISKRPRPAQMTVALQATAAEVRATRMRSDGCAKCGAVRDVCCCVFMMVDLVGCRAPGIDTVSNLPSPGRTEASAQNGHAPIKKCDVRGILAQRTGSAGFLRALSRSASISQRTGTKY